MSDRKTTRIISVDYYKIAMGDSNRYTGTAENDHNNPRWSCLFSLDVLLIEESQPGISSSARVPVPFPRNLFF
jgi:hypothetical protein